MLSTLPFDRMFASTTDANGQNILSALGMLKIMRVGMISGLIASLNFTRSAKAALKVLYLIFFLCLYIHILGCILFFVVSYFKFDHNQYHVNNI